MVKLAGLHIGFAEAVTQYGFLKEERKAAATLIEHTLTFHPRGNSLGDVINLHAPTLNRTQNSFRIFARLDQSRHEP